MSVIQDTSVGVEELVDDGFKLYPNPATEKLIIERTQTGVAIVKLFDVTGRSVLTASLISSINTIDISAFSAGIYTAVLLQNEAVVSRRKIVIQ